MTGRYSRWEMETTINFNMEESKAVLYTRDRTVMRRLDRLVEKAPDIYKCVKETELDKTYEFPKKLLSFRTPVVMSEERRKEASERLKAYREAEKKAGENE